MTEKPRPPVLSDTPRPTVPTSIARWLSDADKIREARDAGLDAHLDLWGNVVVAKVRKARTQ